VRKLRGALGTAVTWAVGWAAGGFALAVILVFLIPGLAGIESGTFADLAPVLTIIGGVSGMLGGTASQSRWGQYIGIANSMSCVRLE
jgi:hypothetical protein